MAGPLAGISAAQIAQQKLQSFIGSRVIVDNQDARVMHDKNQVCWRPQSKGRATRPHIAGRMRKCPCCAGLRAANSAAREGDPLSDAEQPGAPRAMTGSAPVLCTSGDAATHDDAREHCNDREDEQQVHEAAQREMQREPQYPQYEKNGGKRPE